VYFFDGDDGGGSLCLLARGGAQGEEILGINAWHSCRAACTCLGKVIIKYATEFQIPDYIPSFILRDAKRGKSTENQGEMKRIRS
jgi:hypothetical protein